MAQYGLLPEGEEFEMTVAGISEAAGNFKSKMQVTFGQTMYCHHYIMEDEHGVRYKCQICEPKDTQNYCNPGDVMQFKVKRYTMDIHTIEFLARDGQQIKQMAALPESDQPLQKINDRAYNLAVKSVALQSAVAFFTHRVEDKAKNETVLQKAREYEGYLTEQ